MNADLSHRKWMLIGGSAGSLPVMFELLKALPNSTQLTVVIILHRLRYAKTSITEIFAGKTGLQVSEIYDAEMSMAGAVYIAPADYHVLIEANGCFSLDDSEPVCFSRPSIDVTFESFAASFGPQCTAVLLSGANRDGAAGLHLLHGKAAVTIVQSPEEAEVPTMPREALKLNPMHKTLTTTDIISHLSSL